MIRKIFIVPFLKYKRLKQKLRVFLAGHTVAKITYCVTKKIPTRLPVIGQFFTSTSWARTNGAPASTKPGPDHGPDHGPNHGPDHGPDYGPDHGPDRAPDYGSDQGRNFKIQNLIWKVRNWVCWANYTRVTVVSCKMFYLIQMWYVFIPLIYNNGGKRL